MGKAGSTPAFPTKLKGNYERKHMQTIYPDLSIGNSVDGHMALYIESSTFKSILDVTAELPTRKWYRNKLVSLRKVGFAKGKAITTIQLKKALKYIQEQRSAKKHVLVLCDDGTSRSKVIAFAYLVLNIGKSKSEAIDMVGGLDDVPLKTLESIYKFIDKSVRKEVEEVVLVP